MADPNPTTADAAVVAPGSAAAAGTGKGLAAAAGPTTTTAAAAVVAPGSAAAAGLGEGLQGSSSVLMWVMNAAMTRGLRPNAAGAGTKSLPQAGVPSAPVAVARSDFKLDQGNRGVPGASGPLHRSVVVYMDDLLCYSSSLEQHLHDVRAVLAILRQEKLYVKASK